MGILLVLSLIAIFIMLLTLFIIIRTIPGNPYMNMNGYPSQRWIDWHNAQVELWGFNKTPIQQFFIFLWNIISGNWGESYFLHRGTPMNEMIINYFSRFLELNFLSFIFALLPGIIFGVLAYKFKDKWYGLIPQAIKRLNWAIPILGLSLLLVFIFSIKLSWLPSDLYYDNHLEPIPEVTHFRLIDCLLAGKLDYFVDTLKHLILPVICQSVIMFSFIMSLTYSIMDFYKSPKEMHFLSGKIGFYLSFILCSDLLIGTIFCLRNLSLLTIYSIYYPEVFVLSASLYLISLTFLGINIFVTFFLHLILNIIEHAKLSLKNDETTISSNIKSKIISKPTLEKNSLIIESNDEEKKSIAKEIFMNLRRKIFNPLTIFGIFIIFIILIIAIFAKWISPYDYEFVLGIDMSASPDAAPSSEHLFGTTKYGRDVFSRCLYGIQTAVKVGIISTIIGMLLGLLTGAISSFFGKWVKYTIDTINGIILLIPGIFFAILIFNALENDINNIYWILGLVNIPIATLFTQQAVSYEMKRGDIYPLKFSKKNGKKILIRLPNIILSILGVGCLITGLIILTFETINYLGFRDPTTITLGDDINVAEYKISIAPWAVFWPAFCLYITVLGFIMLGIGLKEE